MKMNHKKVLRIMRKYDLLARRRRANPYRRGAKRAREYRSFPNILDRKFTQSKPRTVFCTDITYIPFDHRFAYLSVVKDIATREIVSAYVSRTANMDLVVQTLEKLKHDPHIQEKALIHSDQGVHYTNPAYVSLVKKLTFAQSMSRKGNCVDNAPVESFFGHFKDEVDYRSCRTFEDLKLAIEEHISYYNNVRKQWGLNKMTPVQYRDHLLAK